MSHTLRYYHIVSVTQKYGMFDSSASDDLFQTVYVETPTPDTSSGIREVLSIDPFGKPGLKISGIPKRTAHIIKSQALDMIKFLHDHDTNTFTFSIIDSKKIADQG